MGHRGKSNWLPIALAGVLIGIILAALLFINFRVAPAAIKELQISYADLAAVVLTGVSVMVAILAVFVAALAIWGYSQFGKVTQNASRRHLEKLLEDSPFSHRIENVVVRHVSAQLAHGELRDLLVARVDEILLKDAEAREAAELSTDSREFRD